MDFFFNFVDQAARQTPHAIALEDGERQISWHELASLSRPLSARLQHRGIGTDQIVGILAVSVVDIIIALLAVSKAGAAFFILDRDSSPERLQRACNDAGIALLLTDQPGSGIVAPERELPLLDAGADHGAPVAPALQRHHLAYVIMTSGSTGKPKVVGIEHRSMLSVIAAQQSVLQLSPASRVLQSSSLSFDGFIFELLMVFGSGATLVCRPGGQRPAGQFLADLLVSRQITHMVSIPSVLMITPVTGNECLQVVMSAGEPCPPQLYGRWPQARLLNLYGPAEATIWSTFHEVRSGAGMNVPIGQPIPGADCQVLDEWLNPVAPGREGILYIGESLAARGYLNDPANTAERFVPDPLLPGQRLYKTNDLVRTNSDGELMFVGRSDHQIKIRGFRIDPLEVRECLLACAGVRQAEVMIDGDALGRKSLLAVCVVDDEQRLQPGFDETIIEHVARHLAPQATPARVILLEKMPLNQSFKTDMVALKELARTSTMQPYVPHGEIAALVYESWKQVLELPAIEANGHFFRIGGNSLMAVRLCAQIGKQLNLQLDPAQLYQSPRLQDYIAALEAGQSASPAPGLAGPQPQKLTCYPLSLQQESIWAYQQLHPDSAAYSVCEAFRIKGQFQNQALLDALRQVFARHPVLASRVAGQGAPSLLQDDLTPVAPETAFLPGGDAALADLQTALQQLLTVPIRFAQDKLFRCQVHVLAEGDLVVVFLAHHIIWDGHSSGLLLDHLFRQMAAPDASSASASALAPATAEPDCHCGDYALWQRENLAGGHFAGQGRFWAGYLHGLPARQLFPRQAASGDALAHHRTMNFAASQFDMALRTASACQVSLFTVLLSAFALAFNEWTGAQDFMVGVPVSSRRFDNMQHTLGFLVSTVPFRFRFDTLGSGRELLAQTFRHFQQMHANLDVPFADALKAAAEQEASAAVEVVFSFSDMPAPLPAQAMSCRRVALEVHTAKVPLVFALAHQEAELGGFVLAEQSRINASQLNELLICFDSALARICSDPDAGFSAVEMASDEASFDF